MIRRSPPSAGRFSSVLVLCGVLWTASSLRSQEVSAFQALVDLEARFEAAFAEINEPIAKLNGAYVDALHRLLSSETSAGKLDAALQVKTEIDGFGDGGGYNAADFAKRKTEHAAVAGMRTKYLAERQRLRGLGRRSRDDLARSYQAALASLEQEQTRLGNLEAAIAARNARAALDEDPRLMEEGQDASGSGAFRGRVHVVAKGEIELRYNGAKLPFRNVSRERNKYVDGTSEVVEFRSGGVLAVKMRSTVVYRSLILCLESEDGDIAVPVALGDYRYLGSNLPDKDLDLDGERLAAIELRPENGIADADMAAMWNGKSISTQSRASSEWIKSGPGTDWHCYAVQIREDMPRPVAQP